MYAKDSMMARTVEVFFTGGKKVDAKAGDIVIKTDQPVQNGGESSAPSPFQLFLASIATCTGYYALEFCRARDIATSGMSLVMSCEFDPDAKRYSRMTLSLKLPKGFPSKYEKGILRAMDACTVKRLLLNPPEIRIESVK
jgi:ribosomal protein S12 methylthiotransferase accessory factor